MIYKKFVIECPALSYSNTTATSLYSSEPPHPTEALMLTTGVSTEGHDLTTVSDYLTTEIQNLADNTTDFITEFFNATTAVTLSSTDGHMDVTPDLAHATTNLPSPVDYFLTTSPADEPVPMKSVSHSMADDHTCEAKMLTINLQVSGGP